MELENRIKTQGYLLELYYKLGLKSMANHHQNAMYALIKMRGR